MGLTGEAMHMCTVLSLVARIMSHGRGHETPFHPPSPYIQSPSRALIVTNSTIVCSNRVTESRKQHVAMSIWSQPIMVPFDASHGYAEEVACKRLH